MRVTGPERARLSTLAALASVGMATLLLGAKVWAAITTDSTAMLGSLADTALDLIASLVTLAGVRIAAIPADQDHRFGHGKAEALVALAQVVLISISAVGIGWRAADRLLNGAETANAELGVGVSVAAIAATLLLLTYQRRVIARTGSVAIRTDNLHYRSDLFLNGAVIVALVLDQWLSIRGADAVFGLAIAAWLLWGAWRAAGDSVDQLMDAEWPEEKRTAFLAACADYPELNGIHDVRTRTSGAHDFVQFHVWVPEDWTVREAHDRLDPIEEKLQARFPGTELLIHLDPEGHIDREGMLPHELTERR
ncbi:cation diffusion facilitator family transporter [Sphingomonas sp. BN140010]|uniref:Cation diffusion facilitator family transporter n=1 Tax=Sphingomonas arvum TaxID=2992113 RepID=A0ABT3JGF8_9SPHN|nr:cation diffusion facilitator family transporter [Sphingomonas sp. BN140010]MCW3798172.1 cation diffusion facilitator family transporter [Sphingomonas sp. BN140010]